MRQRLAASRESLARQIEASGRHVVSAFVRSPTFGGASDLAHLGLLSGIDLSDPVRHDLLLTSSRPTLLSLFHSRGYQTIGLYPALSWEWPERAYYGFDKFYDGRDLDYRGPRLGFWAIPDQYTVARIDQMLPATPDSPARFLFFPTITSHLPFHPVPPYQPDWRRVLSPEPYDEAAIARVLADKTEWTNMLPAYGGMIEYTYLWLAGYLGQPPGARLPDDPAGRSPAGRQRQRRRRALGRAGSFDQWKPVAARTLRRPGLSARPGTAATHPGFDGSTDPGSARWARWQIDAGAADVAIRSKAEARDRTDDRQPATQ